MADTIPYNRAVVAPSGRNALGQTVYAHLTFRQLDKESDCLAHGLNRIGIGEGTRTILMVRPCLEFFALIFALFKTGAVPVVVDPGMGVRRMAACYRQTRPQAAGVANDQFYFHADTRRTVKRFCNVWIFQCIGF